MIILHFLSLVLMNKQQHYIFFLSFILAEKVLQCVFFYRLFVLLLQCIE